MVRPAGHAVHHPNDALRGVEVGLEHEGLAPVAATNPVVSAGRSDLPEPVLLIPQQGGEAGSRIETGETEPVDRPVRTDQRRGLGVTQ